MQKHKANSKRLHFNYTSISVIVFFYRMFRFAILFCLKHALPSPQRITHCSGFCLSKCLFVQLHVSQTDLQEIQKNLSRFLSFQTGILTNKSHFKETRSFEYLNFPAKLQAELFDVTHTLLAPRWRRSVVEFWATLEKDFVGI